MKLIRKLFGVAAIMAVIGFLTVTCSDDTSGGGASGGGASGGGSESITFTSIADFGEWLDDQPDNTAASPYTVILNVSSLGIVRNILIQNSSKYVNLDFSGNTLTSIGERAFQECTSLTRVTIPNIRKIARLS